MEIHYAVNIGAIVASFHVGTLSDVGTLSVLTDRSMLSRRYIISAE